MVPEGVRLVDNPADRTATHIGRVLIDEDTWDGEQNGKFDQTRAK